MANTNKVALAALLVFVYRRLRGYKKLSKINQPFFFPDPLVVDFALSLPATLAVGQFLNLGPIIQRWWENYRIGKSTSHIIDDSYLYVILPIYFLVGGGLSFVSIWKQPEVIQNKSIQEKDVESNKLPRLAKVVGFNLILPAILILVKRKYAFAKLSKRKRNISSFNDRFAGIISTEKALPSSGSILKDNILFFLVFDVTFTAIHRLFHTPLFYKHIHKVHHEWTAPIGLASAHAHPIEHALGNIVPVAAAVAVMRPHIVSLNIHVAQILTLAIIEHSGFDLYGTKDSDFHDIHHETFRNNYGVVGVADKLFGTYKSSSRMSY